jgi:hypothetical protein
VGEQFNFEVFDKRSTPLVKRPEVTIQTKGMLSMNASAHHALGAPEAVELLYDRDQKVVGIRPVEPEAAHAYPIRGVKGGSTYMVSGRAFLMYYGVPTDRPVRRDAVMVDGVLIIDLKDPGRDATSNRNRAKKLREERSNGAANTRATLERTPNS